MKLVEKNSKNRKTRNKSEFDNERKKKETVEN